MKTILIVEDDGRSMKLLSDLLRAQGHSILQSIDGMDTLQLARAHRPDLILMDIQLPNISGLEHTRTLKANHDLKHIPVIAVTAHAMKGDESKILEAGCDAYISKPISTHRFLEIVARHLG